MVRLGFLSGPLSSCSHQPQFSGQGLGLEATVLKLGRVGGVYLWLPLHGWVEDNSRACCVGRWSDCHCTPRQEEWRLGAGQQASLPQERVIRDVRHIPKALLHRWWPANITPWGCRIACTSSVELCSRALVEAKVKAPTCQLGWLVGVHRSDTACPV